MTWALILDLILKFLASDLFKDLLDRLFNKTNINTGPEQYSPQEGVKKLFSELQGQTWIFEFGKRAKLKLAERIATKHAEELYRSAKFGVPLPKMSAEDRAELNDY